MNHYTFNKPTHGSPEWLAVRWKNNDGLARISASNAAAVHNEHPFMSGAELAVQLLSDEPPQPEQENRAMQRGNTLEGPVRDWAGQLLNDPLITPCVMYAYEEDGVRLVATIDAVNEHGDVFEIKTKRGRWNGQLPKYWYWQGVQQAICANKDSITWVVFDSDLDIQFHKQVVTSDEKQVHISACRNFLAAIDMGMIPDGATATYRDLSNLYAGNGTSVELNEEQAALVISYVAAQKYISAMFFGSMRPSSPFAAAKSGIVSCTRGTSMTPSMIACATWMPFGPSSLAMLWATARRPCLPDANAAKLALAALRADA